jgi:putative transposase
MSVARSCQYVGLPRTAYYQAPVEWADRDGEVIGVLNRLVEASPRWGFWKHFDRLRALGRQWNHKRAYRVYCALGLNQPRRTKRRLPERERKPLLLPGRANQVWSAGFMSDTLAIEIDTSLRAEQIRRVLDRLEAERGLPEVLRVDNGPEFLSQILIDWAKDKRVLIQYIQPGKPNQNAYIECSNRTYCNEVLDLYLFRNLDEVREITSRRLFAYNEQRPHDALGGLAPEAYANERARISTMELST